MLHKTLASIVLALAVPFSANAVLGQTEPTSAKPTKIPPSLPVLYRHFLAYQLHLERKADALKLQGKNGEDFRTHFQTVLGFSDPEFAKIHRSALHLEKQLQTKDDDIRKAVIAARASLPQGPVPKGFPIPGPPPQLKTLFVEREAIITAEIDTLHKQLTPAESAKLESFLNKDFAPAVTVNPVMPAHTPEPWRLAKEVK